MLKTMIVDDMDIIRREIKRLKLWGEETGFVISDEAKNGHDAIQKLIENPVDLVITDIRMPKIGGIELLKRITAEKLCNCVVLISDHSEFNYARQGLVLGAFDYMVKPINEEEFRKLLERAKDFILEKKLEQERMKQLEQSLIEKAEAYFPRTEINHLVAMMKVGDERAIEYADHLVDIVYSNLRCDLIKAESVLNGIVYEVLGAMQENYKWLDKFIITKKSEDIALSRLADADSIRAAFVLRMNNMTYLLRKLCYGSGEQEMIEQVRKCVLENIDNGISLSAVSDLIFMNKNYVSETFKQKAGMPFTEYLTKVKMERAKKLIADERLKIYEIAEMLGYRDIEYFSKLFRKHIGSSPTEYKKSTGNI